MQRKINYQKNKLAINLNLAAAFILLSASSVYAQNQNNQGQNNQGQMVMPGQNAKSNAITPQPANPFGTVPQQQATNQQGIQYGGQNNLNGQVQLQAQPQQLPTGLPADYQQQLQMMNPGAVQQVNPNIDKEVGPVMNLLNTDNKRIKQVKKDMYDKGRVLNEEPIGDPNSVNDTIAVNLDARAVTPVIRLWKNRTTTITLTDMSGQAWPIVNYDGLPDEDFVVKRLDNPAPDGYVLSITPRGQHVRGNLQLILKGLAKPVNLQFVTGQKTVDGAKEVRINARGPNTQLTGISLPQGIDSELLNVLQGVGPSSAKALTTSSNGFQAWLSRDGQSLYVRTRYKIMGPAFENFSGSPEGINAYKLPATPVITFKTDNGKFGEVTINGL